MSFKHIGILAAALSLAPGQARACEIDPFLFQLPGETLFDAHERSNGTVADHEVVRLYNRELANFSNATTIYLGRVKARTRGSYRPGQITEPSTTVHPMASLKGKAASDVRMLTGEAAGGLCTDQGDGLGAFADVGDLVVVFEGLPKSSYRPRGVDSFKAKSIRTIPLLDELRKHGKDLGE